MNTDELYRQACEIAAQGCYAEAGRLLERCLHENPDNILAHKELAFILKMMGNPREALLHRQEVKRLNPSDLYNRYHLASLHFVLGESSQALKEVEELLALQPAEKRFTALRDVIVGRD